MELIIVIFVIILFLILGIFYGMRLKIMQLKGELDYEKYLNEDLLKQFFDLKKTRDVSRS